jgi:hypothetical protein
MWFEARIWGDPDPTGQNPLFDFDTSAEIHRELLGGMYTCLGGIPNIRSLDPRWEQSTDDNRLGRLLIAQVAFGSDVSAEPWISLPFATPTATGVQIHETVEAVSPDGSQSTTTGVIVVPPA